MLADIKGCDGLPKSLIAIKTFPSKQEKFEKAWF